MENRELVRRCVEGDEAAWAEFLREYGPTLRKLARSSLSTLGRVGSEAETEDVVSGVLEILARKRFAALRSFRWQCTLEGWLGFISRTVSIRLIRRKILPPEKLAGPPGLDSPLERLIDEETAESVRAALRELPPRERAVLSMFYLESAPYRRIAERTGLPMGTIATVISRTRARLREILRTRGLGR